MKLDPIYYELFDDCEIYNNRYKGDFDDESITTMVCTAHIMEALKMLIEEMSNLSEEVSLIKYFMIKSVIKSNKCKNAEDEK